MKKKPEILFSLLTIAVIVVFPHTGLIPFPFGYTIPVLLLVWLCLKYTNQTFADIGFSFKRFGIKPALAGTIGGIIVFSFLTWIFFPVLSRMVALRSNLGDFDFVRGNAGNYIFLLVMGWIVGGLYEEIVFHGFIFTKIENLVPRKYAMAVSFALTNIIFALYHIQLGSGGVINALLAGSAYHALMIYFNRNLWYSVFCHAVFDTIAITFIYAGYW